MRDRLAFAKTAVAGRGTKIGLDAIAMPILLLLLAILVACAVCLRHDPSPTWIALFAIESVLAIFSITRLLRVASILRRDLATSTRLHALERQAHTQDMRLAELADDQARSDDIRDELKTVLERLRLQFDDPLPRSEVIESPEAMTRELSMLLSTSLSRYCEHAGVDAVVAAKKQECAKLGIPFEAALDVDASLPLPDLEICAVFSNLLDNAKNACLHLPEDERYISLIAGTQAGYLIIRTINPVAAEEATMPHRKATGLDEHGWGTAILGDIAQRHDASYRTWVRDGRFYAVFSARVGTGTPQ